MKPTIKPILRELAHLIVGVIFIACYVFLRFTLFGKSKAAKPFDLFMEVSSASSCGYFLFNKTKLNEKQSSLFSATAFASFVMFLISPISASNVRPWTKNPIDIIGESQAPLTVFVFNLLHARRYVSSIPGLVSIFSLILFYAIFLAKILQKFKIKVTSNNIQVFINMCCALLWALVKGSPKLNPTFASVVRKTATSLICTYTTATLLIRANIFILSDNFINNFGQFIIALMTFVGGFFITQQKGVALYSSLMMLMLNSVSSVSITHMKFMKAKSITTAFKYITSVGGLAGSHFLLRKHNSKWNTLAHKIIIMGITYFFSGDFVYRLDSLMNKGNHDAPHDDAPHDDAPHDNAPHDDGDAPHDDGDAPHDDGDAPHDAPSKRNLIARILKSRRSDKSVVERLYNFIHVTVIYGGIIWWHYTNTTGKIFSALFKMNAAGISFATVSIVLRRLGMEQAKAIAMLVMISVIGFVVRQVVNINKSNA